MSTSKVAMRDMLVAMKGYIFTTKLFFTNVNVGSKSTGDKKLAGIKLTFKKGNLFSILVDFCQ